MVKKNILVLGLDLFGESIVKELSKYNCEVLAVDRNMKKIEQIAQYATCSLQVDIKDTTSISALSVNNYDVAIIAIDDIESSIMATLLLKEGGIPNVIVKSKNDMHKKILARIGADTIISPEEEMGIKLAKSIMHRNIVDIINFSEGYNIVEVRALSKWIDHSLGKLDLRNEYGLNVLCIKPLSGELEISPSPNFVVRKGDILIAIADTEKLSASDISDDDIV